MSQIITAITKITDLIGEDKSEFVAKITEWNKSKIYPVSLIDIQIGANGVTDNAEQVGEIIATLSDYVDDMVKNALDAESIADAKKTVAEIGKYIIETRKIQTNPLKEIAGRFTKHEGKFKEFNEALTAKYEAINEVAYKKSEKAIREHFEAIIAEDNLTEIVSMDAFKDFIANKRKTNIFTSKGALSKGIKDAIAEALRVVVEPIKEANALKEKKALQSKQFNSYLDGIPTDGDTPVLEASIKSLDRLKESIEELYPDIIEECLRNIDNKVSRCSAHIRANKSEAEKEAIQNADGKDMELFNAIRVASTDMTLGLQELKGYANSLREIYPRLTFSENQEKVKTLGASLNQRVIEIQATEMTPIDIPATEVVPDLDKESYFVSIEDIEVLAGMEIVADNEDEAKKELVRRFEAHLDMIDLITKDV